MATVDPYTPQFQPPGWRDNVDLVSADGPNGFNAQFTTLRAELDTISNRISEIIAALQTVGQKPPAQVNVAFTPNLVTIATAPAGWAHELGFAEKSAGQTSARGMMSVNLPNGVKILTLRATGINAGSGGPGAGTLRIILQRQKIVADGSKPDAIATVTTTGVTPFDSTVPADQTMQVVAMDQYKYFILAQLDNAATADVVQLNAFQIVYLTTGQ
ncbi:MAG TPA: hypothetical protein VII61_17735 [Ktedonobacteraceae bacterium]|jgi:hypothetical protein